MFDLLTVKKSLQISALLNSAKHSRVLDEHFIVITIPKEVLTNYLDRLIQYYIIELQTTKLTNFEDLVNLFLSVLEPVH